MKVVAGVVICMLIVLGEPGVGRLVVKVQKLRSRYVEIFGDQKVVHAMPTDKL